MNSITRRDMLRRTGLAGVAATGLPLAVSAGTQLQSDQPSPGPNPKLKVMVTGGHPGDPEYGCGGTIALYSEQGHDVVILYLNKGEWTDRPGYDPGPVRAGEAAKACEILKARPIFARQLDARAIIDNDHYEQFRRLIEAEQPDVVFTQWPIDNHRDHRAVSMLTYDACVRMGRKFALYYYEVSNGEDTVQFAPTHYVDITGVESRKRSACYAHASQSPDKFYALQGLVMRMRGIEVGAKQAEAFIHHVQSPRGVLPK